MAEDNPRARSRIPRAVAGVLALPSHPGAIGWRLGFGGWPLALRGWLAQEIERRGLFPWIAVAFGVGILLFFQADGRPGLWAPAAGLALSVAAAIAARRTVTGLGLAIAAAAIFAGFGAAVIRTSSVEAPML